MRKIIKKYGDSFIIRLTPEEMIAHDLEINEIIDVEIAKIESQDGNTKSEAPNTQKRGNKR